MTKYLVWCPELGAAAEDGRDVTAHDFADAACIWARGEDGQSADYWIVGGDGATVMVRSPDGTEQSLRVTGEQDIHYRAWRVTPNVEAERRRSRPLERRVGPVR